MALGRRKEKTQALWVATTDLPQSQGHPFYRTLNRLLAEASFDRKVEEMCASFYAERQGRPSIPPGVYFRMLFVGYFEGLDSQRGIAWRCNDSLSLREFIGVGATGRCPDHSSLTVIRKRLPLEIHESVFALVLGIAREKRLLDGKTIGVDATLLEANAAMKSIVRRESGEDWKAYVKRLAEEAGLKDPTGDDLRRFDKDRGGKSTPNDEWVSKSDPDATIMRMKDGRTHLSFKAEHAVDLESELIVAATVSTGRRGDADSLPETVSEAQVMLAAIGCEQRIEEVVADRGYHAGPTLAGCMLEGIRTYAPAQKQVRQRNWNGKTAEERRAVTQNDRRVSGPRGRRLQRQRSEKVERGFAHVCDSGGARRSWLRGRMNVLKRYLMTVAAHNLGRILWTLFGVGKPRGLQGHGAAWAAVFARIWAAWTQWLGRGIIRCHRIADFEERSATAQFVLRVA